MWPDVNGIQSQHSLFIWTLDTTTGQWTQENDGKALAYQESVTISRFKPRIPILRR
jgi:hypothetical protein